MKPVAALSLSLLLVALVVTPVAAKRMKPDPTRSILADLHVAAKCDDKTSPFRPWCVAADGWATGTLGKLTRGKVMVGITITRTTAATGPWDLAADPSIHLSALAVVRDGPQWQLRLTEITPDTDSDKLAIAGAIGNISAVLKGRSKLAKIDKALAGYLKTLTKVDGHVATEGDRAWTWESETVAELRKVGKFWVVIETTKTGPEGRFITILTESWR